MYFCEKRFNRVSRCWPLSLGAGMREKNLRRASGRNMLSYLCSFTRTCSTSRLGEEREREGGERERERERGEREREEGEEYSSCNFYSIVVQ